MTGQVYVVDAKCPSCKAVCPKICIDTKPFASGETKLRVSVDNHVKCSCSYHYTIQAELSLTVTPSHHISIGTL